MVESDKTIIKHILQKLEKDKTMCIQNAFILFILAIIGGYAIFNYLFKIMIIEDIIFSRIILAFGFTTALWNYNNALTWLWESANLVVNVKQKVIEAFKEHHKIDK